MQKIKLIAMGKLTECYTKTAADEFMKRISRFYSLTVCELRPENVPSEPSDNDIEKALLKESEKIIAEIPPRSKVIAMCVEGKPMTSPAFAEMIADAASSGTPDLCFIIGSSHGLHDSVKKQANVKLSFSPMTFPHELFRVMLLEQIYRSGEILNGGKYHK